MAQQEFTTRDRFKAWYNFQGTTIDDGLIDDLIRETSVDLLAYLGRSTLLKATYNDVLNGHGGCRQILRQWPVGAVSAVSVDGTPVSASAAAPAPGWLLDVYDGYPPGRPQYVNMIGSSFCRGVQNVVISYSAGYYITDEAGTIPASGLYQIKAAQEWGLWARDDGVKNASTGAALTKVTGTPATGQYSVAAGLYSFAAADAGSGVLISYSFIPATLEGACKEIVAERYAYRQRIGRKSDSFQGSVTTSYDNTRLTQYVMNKIQPYKRQIPF